MGSKIIATIEPQAWSGHHCVTVDPPGETEAEKTSKPAPKTTYRVEVLRTFGTSAEVAAESPEAAVRIVAANDFPLGPVEEWDPLNGWEFVVLENTEEVYRED